MKRWTFLSLLFCVPVIQAVLKSHPVIGNKCRYYLFDEAIERFILKDIGDRNAAVTMLRENGLV